MQIINLFSSYKQMTRIFYGSKSLEKIIQTLYKAFQPLFTRKIWACFRINKIQKQIFFFVVIEITSFHGNNYLSLVLLPCILTIKSSPRPASALLSASLSFSIIKDSFILSREFVSGNVSVRSVLKTSVLSRCSFNS